MTQFEFNNFSIKIDILMFILINFFNNLQIKYVQIKDVVLEKIQIITFLNIKNLNGNLKNAFLSLFLKESIGIA